MKVFVILEHLGKRMEAAESSTCRNMAPVCYIAAGWVEPLVEHLTRKKGASSLTAEHLHVNAWVEFFGG